MIAKSNVALPLILCCLSSSRDERPIEIGCNLHRNVVESFSASRLARLHHQATGATSNGGRSFRVHWRCTVKSVPAMNGTVLLDYTPSGVTWCLTYPAVNALEPSGL